MQRVRYTTTVLTKCAANVLPIGPIVRSQTRARMQRGDSFEEIPWDFYKVRCKRLLHHLLSSAFFSDRAFVVLDMVHVADCKGVTALVLGSIVSTLLEDDRLGTEGWKAAFGDLGVGKEGSQEAVMSGKEEWVLSRSLRVFQRQYSRKGTRKLMSMPSFLLEYGCMRFQVCARRKD